MISQIDLQDIIWKAEWFRHRKPSNYWDSNENCRKFLDTFAINQGIDKFEGNWRIVTSSLIEKQGGYVHTSSIFCDSKGLLSRFHNSLYSMLQAIYPNNNWTSMLETNIQRKQKVNLFEL